MKIWLSLVFYLCIINGGFVTGTGDGTTSINYQAEPYTFSIGESAQGFVHFNSGFLVPAGASVTLNLLTPVNSIINLHRTGEIKLEGDLFLSPSVSFVNGGKINGQGHTIFLQGDLTIPKMKQLTFTGNTIIDGQGHAILFEEFLLGGIMAIDGVVGTTLTLKNVVLKGVKNSLIGKSIIFGSASGQKLVLDNAVVNLAGSFVFDGGLVTIANDTIIRGPYTFFYASANDCTILKDATLMFDLGTTFQYAPSDKKSTHVIFENRTSHLFLNGCTLSLPVNGLKLIKGHLVIDNKVMVTGHDVIGPQALKEADGLTFGDGSIDNMLYVDMCAAARLELGSVMLVYRNVDGVLPW